VTGRRSIQTRVLLLVTIGMVGPLALMAWAGSRVQRQFEQELLADRTLLARSFAARVDALLSSELEAMQLAGRSADPAREIWNRRRFAALFKGYQVAPGESIDVVDAGGKVIASTDPARLLRDSDHAQFMAGLIRERRSASGSCHGCHQGSQGRVKELIAFSPLSVAHWGVAVRQPQTDTFAFAGGLSRNVIAIAAAMLGVALLFAWGASRSVIGPLASLTRAAETLAAGELNEPIRRLADDEIGRLRDALERMRVALKESIVRQLLARTMTAQEHERRRVARELHDETTQGLAALVMKIRAAAADAPPGPLHARLEDATALAVRTLDEVHRMIVDLRPSVLDDLGLKSAIVWCADKHLKSRGIAVRCEFADFERRLPPQHEIAVFRVAQEAMNNIARHAKAETVLIQASIRENRLTLEIEDDGAGFDASTLASPVDDGRGFGLLGMRERVEMLGGKLRIESAPGQGTDVAVSLPLEEEPWIGSAS
jgi:signal transduction histidine kinase